MNPDTFFAHSGSYYDAMEFHRNNGGMLYEPKTIEHHTTIRVGSHTHTFYPPNSYPVAQARQLAKQFGLPDELVIHMTASRLSRWYIDNILRLPYQNTFWARDYQDLAKQGYHWHYLYAEPGRHGHCFEIDLKSAYATAWVNRPSLLFDHRYQRFLKDGGAVNRLKEDLPYLPKWFRLALLGVISGHCMRFKVHKKGASGYYPEEKIQNRISYGAAFNAAHIAVWKVYNVMQELHKIFGSHVKRAHTDGMIISIDATGDETADIAHEFIREKGFEYSLKASGQTWVKNVGEGICGGKCFGQKQSVLKEAYKEGFLPSTEKLSVKDVGVFGRNAASIAGLLEGTEETSSLDKQKEMPEGGRHSSSIS